MKNSCIHSFSYPFSLSEESRAAALGLEIPHDQQQSLIVLLAPHQDGTKQGRRCNYVANLVDVITSLVLEISFFEIEWMLEALFRGCKQNLKSSAKSKRLILQLPTVTSSSTRLMSPPRAGLAIGQIGKMPGTSRLKHTFTWFFMFLSYSPRVKIVEFFGDCV